MTPVAAVKEPTRKVLFAGQACERFLTENVSWASLEESDRLSEHELMTALIDWIRREVKPKKKDKGGSRTPRRNGPEKK